MSNDLHCIAIYPTHPAVRSHTSHKTLQSVDAKREKAEERERKVKEAEEKKRGEIQVVELWKPFGTTIPWFVAAEKEYASPTQHIFLFILMEVSSVPRIFITLRRSKKYSTLTLLQNSL